MKKALIVFLFILAAPAMATTMCAQDDVLAMVFDPAIGGTNHTSNSDLFEWSAVFSYGTIWGIATCVDTSGSSNTAVDELKSSDGTVATGGERTGSYCWCQITHPVRSRWVFQYAFGSVASCRSNCANNCGFSVRSTSAFRAGLFRSLGN